MSYREAKGEGRKERREESERRERSGKERDRESKVGKPDRARVSELE